MECAKHQWIHLAFENVVVKARWRSTWVRVYISLTLQSSYKPSMHFTMTCTTTHHGRPPGILFEAIHQLPLEGGGGEEHFGARKIKIVFLGP